MTDNQFMNERGEFRVYTHLTISAKAKVPAKKFLNSIRRKLPQNWHIVRSDYVDEHTFKLVDNPTGFQMPEFVDTTDNKHCRIEMWFGVINECISLLKIYCWKDGKIEKNIEAQGYAIWKFYENVLIPSAYFKDFDFEFRYGGRSDAHWIVEDIREKRPIALFSLKEKQTMILSQNSKASLDSFEINFTDYNNIALCLSTAKKSYLRALNILKKLNKDPIISSKPTKNNTAMIYDFLEEMQSSVIFSYTAVEAFVNVSIPNDFEYTRFNEKGIKEIWNKNQIERWISTSDKITEILPLVFDCGNIKDQVFWTGFKDLEKLRNQLIHQKSQIKDETSITDSLFSARCKSLIEAATKLIDFFYSFKEEHHYYPLGIGIASYQTIEIESFKKHFKVIEK